MPFEVDFMPVGGGERSGDAFALRFGNLSGLRSEQTICVIDGGTKESGDALVACIRNDYGTDYVDFVICSHPDSDHSSGLSVVLEELRCGLLIMHRPWEHSDSIHHMFDDPKLTPDKLAGRMERNLFSAHELEQIATRKGIQIVEPFQGLKNETGSIHVLGPEMTFYQSLLTTFRDMPELKTEISVISAFKGVVSKVATWVEERYDIETLVDPSSDLVSAENNSSCIVLFTVDSQKLLFTGDAGCEALSRAIDYARSVGISLDDLYLLQVPHHGSRRNVGPTILNQIKAKTAFISVGPDGAPKHPSRRVTNALRRRGATVCLTAGKRLMQSSPAWPLRSGWVPAPEVPFYLQVEDE